MHLLMLLRLGLIQPPPNPSGGNSGDGLLLLLFPEGGLLLLLFPKAPNPLSGFAPTVP